MAKFIHYIILTMFLNMNLYGDEQPDILKLSSISQFEKKYGKRAKNRLESYYQILNKTKTKSTREQLININNFFNRFQYKKDQINWNKSEYWANIKEFIIKGSGDCEDYAIAKYFTLLRLGVPPYKLKITYSKLLNKRTKTKIPHMVLTYVDYPGSQALILDNTVKKILPFSKRNDLIIIKNPSIKKQISKKLDQLLIYKI